VPTEHLNYLYPYNEDTRKSFFEKFFLLNKDFDKNKNVKIVGRIVKAEIVSTYGICFNFNVICGDGRGTHDYIEICSTYKHIFIYNLVEFDESNEDMARRFIALIDECYDQAVHVVILATNDFKDIYQGKRLAFGFQRTISRINDMQNSDFGVNNV
jgi:cell division protein ZapE